MPISWKQESPHRVVCRVTGEMSYDDFVRLNQGGAPPPDGIKSRALFLLEDFEGWATSESWGDLEFVDRNDEMLDRIAIVGEERWREQMELFMLKGLRPVEIRYFTPDQEPLARAWLGDE